MFHPAIIEEIFVFGAFQPSHPIEIGMVSPHLPTELVDCRTKRETRWHSTRLFESHRWIGTSLGERFKNPRSCLTANWRRILTLGPYDPPGKCSMISLRTDIEDPHRDRRCDDPLASQTQGTEVQATGASTQRKPGSTSLGDPADVFPCGYPLEESSDTIDSPVLPFEKEHGDQEIEEIRESHNSKLIKCHQPPL